MGKHSLPVSHPVAARSCRGRLFLPALAVAPLFLGGCASLLQVVSHPVMTGMGLMSMAVTGKGLADHALDMVTRQDCRLLEGLVKEQRALCEKPGSLATLGDFRGIGRWTSGDDSRRLGAGRLGLALDSRLDSRGGLPSTLSRDREDSGADIRLALSLAPTMGLGREPVPHRTVSPAGVPAPDSLALLQ